jgi:hypothetical protein
MLNFFINTAYAAATADQIIARITTNIINPIMGILFGLAFVVFLYGIVEFIQGAGNEKAVEKGKQHIMWGILGLVIMVGFNGIITLISSTVTTLGN